MISTNNHKTIATLAKKSLKANRARNFTIICAIVLTTLLITSVFTLALSINKSMQRAQMQTTKQRLSWKLQISESCRVGEAEESTIHQRIWRLP